MHLCIIINPPFHPTLISHPQCYPPFIYLVQKLTNEAPTLHQSLLAPPYDQAILHWGTHFCTCTSNPIIFYSFGNCKNHILYFNKYNRFFPSHLMVFSLGTLQPSLPLIGASHFPHTLYNPFSSKPKF
jgi:hypothetical protein